MLVFGGLSFQVLPDNTIEIAANAKQSLTYVDIQELLSWLNYYSNNYHNRNHPKTAYGNLGAPGGVHYIGDAPPQLYNGGNIEVAAVAPGF